MVVAGCQHPKNIGKSAECFINSILRVTAPKADVKTHKTVSCRKELLPKCLPSGYMDRNSRRRQRYRHRQDLGDFGDLDLPDHASQASYFSPILDRFGAYMNLLGLN